MAATLQWYEAADNSVDADGNYPGDESGLLDVERMVGDLASGRRFTDPVETIDRLIPGTTPSRTEALRTLQRAEDAFIEWLTTGGYIAVTPAYSTSYPSPFRTLLEARGALAAVRLLATRPTHERDAVLDDETGRRRIDGFAYQVRTLKAEILAGTFPLPRAVASGSSVGAPPPREPSFTFELGV